MKKEMQSERCRWQLRVHLLAALSLMVMLGLCETAFAQSQWTTNGNDISNTNTGNVGIGTTTPAVKLDLNGPNAAASTGSANGGLIIGALPVTNLVLTGGVYSGTDTYSWFQSRHRTSALYYNLVFQPNGGYVGIGTTNPSGQLEVKSAASVHNTFSLNTTTAGYANTIAFLEAGTTKASIQHNPSVLGGGLLFNTNGGASPANTRMVINAAGSVGIGTTTPSYRFDVQGGQINSSGGLCIAGDCKTAWSQVGGGSQWTTSGSNVYYNSGNVGIGTASPSYRLHISGDNTPVGGYPIIKIQNTQAGGHSYWLYSGANGNAADFGLFDETDGIFRLYAKGTSGNIGIGTITPNDKLEVAGNIRMSSGYFFSAVGGNLKLNADSANDIEFYQNGGVKAGIYDGSLGIGTTTPGNLLQLNSGVGPASGQFRISANNAGSLSGIAYAPNNVALGYDVDYANGAWIARDASVAWLYKTTSKFFIQGSTGNAVGGAAAANSYMTVDLANGNVGIGTTSPTAKLHVVGDITVTGNINAKYQDVAEWVPAQHNLPAGTVVVLNPAQSNQVMASEKSYDTRVAGVVSEKPGLTLGEAGKDKVLVATTGRVKVKVDATRAPIRVGDLLVTSDQEGVAMKSEPLSLGGTPIHRPGTLIGKALEPLEKGTGEILVLLSLQ